MYKSAFLLTTQLQYSLKAARDRILSLESGAEFQKMQSKLDRQRHYYERQLRERDRKIEKLSRMLDAQREKWFEIFEDIQTEMIKKLEEKDRSIEKLKAQLGKKSKKQHKLMREVTETRAKLNDEKEKNQKLKAQVNQNFENSSTPSSQDPFRNKVPNNRVSTGRGEGGQPGHEGHGRKRLPVTEKPVFIDAPDEIKNNPDYYKLEGKQVHKQVIGIRLSAVVTDYYADVYRNRLTGARYHAPFPEGVVLDVNYDESIKAFVFLLRNHLNVSIDKTGEFIREMTDGKVSISHGMICGINKEFSEKTREELLEIFARLAASEVVYTDMTNVRHNGKLKNVVVCSNKEEVFYAFRDKKGNEGLKGTPVEYSTGVLSHDHDKTFYRYGGAHQDCNYHHTRYLRGAIENEPDLEWHRQMLDLLLEMNAERERQERNLGEDQIKEFKDRYDRILDLAEQEYYDNPPSRYYRKGYNLSKELRDYKEAVLLFLTNPKVDFGNNEAERCARKAKRHTVVSGSFRGATNEGGEAYCQAMSVLESDRRKGINVYQQVKDYFKRPKAAKKEKQSNVISMVDEKRIVPEG